MDFEVDSRISDSSFWLGNWSLSSVYLKNEANFPWVILVPREKNLREIYQLSQTGCQQLMHEITRLSEVMNDYFKPDKLNVGALGNIVEQLHIHIVARFKQDKLWPHGIWQPDFSPANYQTNAATELVQLLRERLQF